MSNLLDYIHWRGDISFAAVPVHAVDALILSELAMCRWELGLRERESAPLDEIPLLEQGEPVSAGFCEGNDRKLLDTLRTGERFGKVRLSDYVCETDDVTEKQFAAMAFQLADGSCFVAFRGTDRTLVGWKEDCNMAFTRTVPAQEAARDYLARIAEKHPGPLYVGGHSKGGNLAMFAAATIDASVRERILAVYNFDGPGLSDLIDAPALYARLTRRLHSFVPQGSIVGLLLAHPDTFTVVKSSGIGFLQHDPYTWQVDGPHFLQLESLSSESVRFDFAFRKWIDGLDEAQRAEFVDTLFSILSASKAQVFGKEFWISLAQNTKSVRAALSQVDPETRRRINRMIADFGKLAMLPHPET